MIRFSDAMPDLLKDAKKALEQTRAIAQASLRKAQSDTDKFIKQNSSVPSQVCDKVKGVIKNSQEELTDEIPFLYKWS